MKRCRLVLLFGLLLTFAGCNTLMPMLFGFREINGYDAEQCEKFYRKLPKDFAFTPLVCDEEQFYQPLKIMYFHGDTLVSYHINCYCPPTLGFNLNWNFNHQFDEFPPATTVPLEGYTVTRAKMQSVFPEIKGDLGYTVLVFWTNMLHKISKSEIKTVYKNLKKFGHLNDAEVYLINNDIPLSGLVTQTE